MTDAPRVSTGTEKDSLLEEPTDMTREKESLVHLLSQFQVFLKLGSNLIFLTFFLFSEASWPPRI